MTQQYYDPNAGQYGAPQGYQPPPPPPYAQPNPYQQPPQGYAPPNPYGQPQGYGYAPPAQPQAPQGAPGSLEEFFGQPNTGGGKGISWKGVPDGYTLQGVVARPITNGDVFQESDPVTKALKFWPKDGRPKMAMQVPLKLQWLDQLQQQMYPDGEAKLYVRGQLRDELTRAMAEAGAPEGPPEAGAFVRVTLTHRKPGNTMPTNQFAIVYRSPGTWENGAAPQTMAPQQAPYQQPATAQYAAPAQAAPNPQQYAAAPLPQGQAQPQYGQQAYNPNPQQAPQFSAPGTVTQSFTDPAPMAQAYQANPNPQQAPQYGQAPAGAASAGDPAANPNPQQAPQYGQPAAPNGYTAAPGPVAAPNPQAQQPQYVQDQLPMQPQGQAPQGNPNPQQPPVQPGVQPSALDPGRQALLARLQGGQQAPAPQG